MTEQPAALGSPAFCLERHHLMSNDFTVPAGWYPDPLGHPQLRWWKGDGWTEQVSAAPQPEVVAPVVAAPVVVSAPVAPVAVTPAVVAPALHELEAPPAAAKVVDSPVEAAPAAAAAVPEYVTVPAQSAPAPYSKYSAPEYRVWGQR